MSTATLATIEELGELPPPPPARPRVLLLATALASAAAVMLMAGLLGLYAAERGDAIAAGDSWLPEGVDIPLTPGNLSLIGFGIAVSCAMWAVQAIGADDRRHAWMAFAATLAVGAFHLVGMGFLFSQMELAVNTLPGTMVYAVLGAHLVMVGAAMLFSALMAFRTLGGQYSARDREGVVAAAVVWWATAAVYAAVWYAVLVTK